MYENQFVKAMPQNWRKEILRRASANNPGSTENPYVTFLPCVGRLPAIHYVNIQYQYLALRVNNKK